MFVLPNQFRLNNPNVCSGINELACMRRNDMTGVDWKVALDKNETRSLRIYGWCKTAENWLLLVLPAEKRSPDVWAWHVAGMTEMAVLNVRCWQACGQSQRSNIVWQKNTDNRK